MQKHTIGEKVAIARRECNPSLSQEDLARRINVSLRTVFRIEKTGQTDIVKLKKIAQATGRNISYFLTEEADSDKTFTIKNIKIPVVSMARGDDDHEGFEFQQLDPHEYEYIDFSNCKAIQITTNSMAPVCYKGQKIIYCENHEVQDGDLVFIGLKSGEQYFKRLARDGKSKYVTLEPLNVIHYKSKTIKQSEIKFMHKVVGVKF